MQKPRRILIVALSLLALTGSAAFLINGLRSPESEPKYATVLPSPAAVAEFALRDHTGAIFDRDSFRDRWSLVFFGFTHCPDICPATLQQLAIARSRLAVSGKPLPQILLISVDPERDTPGKLAEYVGHFGAGVIGVTGDLAELRKLTSGLGIWFGKSRGANDDYELEHSSAVVVINEDAELQALFSAPHSVDAFVADLPRIMSTT